MAKLNRIVDIKTLVQTTSIRKNEFNAALFLTPHANSLQRIIAVRAADDLIGLGFTTHSPAYKAALTYFAQKPSASNFFIGRVALSEMTVVIKNKDIMTGSFGVRIKTYDDDGNVVINDALYQAESQADDKGNITQPTEKSIYDGIKAQIDSNTVTVSSTNNGLIIRAKSVDKPFTVNVLGNIKQESVKSSESFVEALIKIQEENPYWYGLGVDTESDAEILEIAEWVEANQKLLGVKGSSKVIDGALSDDIASKLKSRSFGRTFVIATNTPFEYPQLALMSQCFAYYPGQETWANKKLSTITSDNLLESEYQAAMSKNATTYELFAGQLSLTQTGKLSDGEWIDVLRFSDWLQTEIQADVASLFARSPKIPYTDGGIQIISNAMLPALNLGVARGGIAPSEIDDDGNVIKSFEIKVPRASNISPNNKGLRVLQDLYVIVRLAGAIHRVEMQLTFTYQNI